MYVCFVCVLCVCLCRRIGERIRRREMDGGSYWMSTTKNGGIAANSRIAKCFCQSRLLYWSLSSHKWLYAVCVSLNYLRVGEDNMSLSDRAHRMGMCNAPGGGRASYSILHQQINKIQQILNSIRRKQQVKSVYTERCEKHDELNRQLFAERKLRFEYFIFCTHRHTHTYDTRAGCRCADICHDIVILLGVSHAQFACVMFVPHYSLNNLSSGINNLRCATMFQWWRCDIACELSLQFHSSYAATDDCLAWSDISHSSWSSSSSRACSKDE